MSQAQNGADAILSSSIEGFDKVPIAEGLVGHTDHFGLEGDRYREQ